jgi:GNAT superfamily N-acetyltransferase
LNVTFRYGHSAECAALEALQRRASLEWEEYRADLLANPDAIELPLSQLQENLVRVAETGSQAVGFSVVVPKEAGVSDLDGLFVEPAWWGRGIGRLLIADALQLAGRQGAHTLEVVGNPRARGFYERCGFAEFGQTATRFGPGICMRHSVGPSSR